MELRHLRYFVAAAEAKSISRAAERLNISQPGVSRQIRNLEEELGVALFERNHRGLVATEPGQSALIQARHILQTAEDLKLAMEGFRRPRPRSIKVGFIATALPGFLAGAMRRFHRSHDDVCIEIHEKSPTDQQEALRTGALDLALLGSPCPELEREFRVEPILEIPMAVVLPDDHLLASRESLELAEIATEPFVSLHEKHFPGRPAMLAKLCQDAGFIPEVRQKAEGLQEMLGLVAGGAGVGVLPADVSSLPHPGVVFIRMQHPSLTLVSSAVWKSATENQDLLELVALLKTSAE